MKGGNFNLSDMTTKPSKHVEKAAAGMNREPAQRLNVEIPGDLHAQLKSVASLRKKTIKEVAVEMIADWIERNK